MITKTNLLKAYCKKDAAIAYWLFVRLNQPELLWDWEDIARQYEAV